MVISKHNFYETIQKLSAENSYGLDTETTGLNSYANDYLFAAIFSDHDGAYYFNFNHYDNLDPQYILPRAYIQDFQLIFDNPKSLWFLHNAKFDIGMLAREGVEILGNVHCTMAAARLEYNAHIKYDLASCAKRIGLEKSEAVEEHIKKEGLWEWEQIPGKKTRTKKKYFNLVPFEIMQPYGEMDAVVVRKLGLHQIEKIKEIDQVSHESWPKLQGVLENERRLTKTCFGIERAGVKIDKGYCERAVEFETRRYESAARDFESICGLPFIDSNKSLEEAFKRVGIGAGQTSKGNPSFAEGVLDEIDHPLARSVIAHRESSKRANTYFRNYLYFGGREGIIHANIKQSGTETGRFSYGDPNLQNVPKRGEDDQEFSVRRSFIPREGHFFAMFDYDQMEYKLMVDYAGETELIEKILAGHDVHDACSDMMNIGNRERAKTINFQNLYGGGDKKLAQALKISLQEAKELRMLYWEKLPKVGGFIRGVSRAAKSRGYVYNWMGRRCHFPNPEFAYAAPNHLIQGGCADIVKVAMNRIDCFLKNKKSKMLIQIHDELVLEVPEDEKSILPEIKHIMETSYQGRHLNLTCGVEHSYKSWFDKVEGFPDH